MTLGGNIIGKGTGWKDSIKTYTGTAVDGYKPAKGDLLVNDISAIFAFIVKEIGGKLYLFTVSDSPTASDFTFDLLFVKDGNRHKTVDSADIKYYQNGDNDPTNEITPDVKTGGRLWNIVSTLNLSSNVSSADAIYMVVTKYDTESVVVAKKNVIRIK